MSDSAAVRVDPVSSSSDLREFVELAYRIYAGDPSWPPPLRSDVRWMLDEAKNPFWKHAKRKLFLARKGGRVVGRIAAIADAEHNRVHADKTVSSDSSNARTTSRRAGPSWRPLRGPCASCCPAATGCAAPRTRR